MNQHLPHDHPAAVVAAIELAGIATTWRCPHSARCHAHVVRDEHGRIPLAVEHHHEPACPIALDLDDTDTCRCNDDQG